QVTVILDHRAAARSIDDQRIDPIAAHHLPPGVDIPLGELDRLGLATHVMHQRTAAARAWGDLHVDTAAGEQADGGIIDLWPQHPSTITRPLRSAFVTAVPGPLYLGERSARLGARSSMATSSFRPSRRMRPRSGRPSGASRRTARNRSG